MATTPSGMSIAEAEALSLQQQQQIQANLPKEGQVFLRDIGEGGRQLSVIKGGKIYGLGFNFPQEWQGRTIGSWQNQYTSQYAQQLGLDLNNLYSGPVDRLIETYGQPQSVVDVNQFSGFLGGNAYAGPTQQVTSDVSGLPQGAVAARQALIDQQATSPMAMAMNNQNLSQGVYIPNEQVLQQKRQELAAAGVPQSEWSKYISSPDSSGKLYFRQPATLYGPNGAKKVVATGSQEANDLFKSGWGLNAPMSDSVISSSTMTDEPTINLGDSTPSNTYGSDTVAGGFNSTISATEAEIKRLQELLIGDAPSTTNSQALDDLIASLDPDSLTGRGAMQLSEEARRGIEQQRQALIAKQAELRQKTDEINALTQSYNLANQTAEGKSQTLSRLQGVQAQNYKMYLAQKNSLTADAAFIQSDLLAMQNQLTNAQEAANRAVDLMYSDRLDRYNATINKINILKPQVEKEEARYLAGIQLDLQNAQASLAQEAATRKEIQGLKMDYIQQMLNAGRTPDAGVLSDFGKMKSLDQAIDLYASKAPRKTIGSSTTTVNQQAREAIQADIAAIRGSDGYVDTAKFRQIRESVAVNEPDQLAWFDNTYAPEQVLNPNDPTSARYVQTPAQFVENAAYTTTEEGTTISAAPKEFKWWDPRTWGN